MAAIVVTVLHRPTEPDVLDDWLSALRADCTLAAGFVDCVASVADDERLDLAVAVSFRTEPQLGDWLDGASRRALLDDGAARGIRRAASDLVVVEGKMTPPGVAVFTHPVAAGRERDFTVVQGGLAEVSAPFTGYQGTVVFPAETRGRWLSLIRFRTEGQLTDWLESDQRQDALPALRSTLTRDFTIVSATTPFGTTVRTENGQTTMTPNWKSVMMVLLVLYPTVMLLSRFFGPILDRVGAEPWLALWISQVISVAALQYWLMPWAMRPFRRFLDPVDGAGVRISVIGATAIVAIYALTLLLFASVRWLQYWDFGN